MVAPNPGTNRLDFEWFLRKVKIIKQAYSQPSDGEGSFPQILDLFTVWELVFAVAVQWNLDLFLQTNSVGFWF